MHALRGTALFFAVNIYSEKSMAYKLERYRTDIVAFVDDLIKNNELGRPLQLLDHQREILSLAFKFDDHGQLPYETILYCCPKKSGKTTVNALVTLWWAFTQESPNEILIVANDFEQAQNRTYRSIAGMIRHNKELIRSAEILAKQINLSNGTSITALASEYAGAAGSNHGETSWDEVWAYVSESAQRLWEELCPVPTRLNSIRFVTTNAGWEGESTLLWDLYRQGVGHEEHPEGQGKRIHPDLPVYANREARLFVYWDHQPRMPWQTEKYYHSQKRSLRPATYLRLHENRWTTAETIFITPSLWDQCVDTTLSPVSVAQEHRLLVGVDAGIKHDTAAVVAVRWDGDKLTLASHRIWRPSPKEPLNLEETIEAYLRGLYDLHDVAEILCDPYQLHRSITTLKEAGLPIREFPQTTANTTLMGQTLFDLLNGKNLRLYSAEELRQQALNTVAIENPRGWRIAKEKASRKIDAIVALAIGCVAAIEAGRIASFDARDLWAGGERQAYLDDEAVWITGPRGGRYW